MVVPLAHLRLKEAPYKGGSMDISLTNVHLDLGAGRRGTDMGPSAIHVAGLVPGLEKLGHTIHQVLSLGGPSFEALTPGNPSARS